MSIDPRVQILYLVAVGVTAFVFSDPRWLLGLLALQVALWLRARLPVVDLVTVLRKLVIFFVVIVISFGFFESEPGDRHVPLVLFGQVISLNLSGALRGLLFSSRVLTVIYASQLIQRSGEGTALVRGLRGLHVPAVFAYSLDLVLALLGADAPRRGPGRGGRRRGADAEPPAPPEPEASRGRRTLDLLRRGLRGDVGFLIELIQANIARARERAEVYGLRPQTLSDVAILAGLAVVSMTIRALHVLPGFPVAPGHKGVIMLPLYLVAHELTTSRWGASRLGVVVGIISFLMGEGKFGVFEVVRHITAGVFVDVAMGLVRRVVREPGGLVYAVVGVGTALARLSTIVLVGLFVDVPAIFYAFLIPQAISHSIFGFLSGFVTFHLMKSMQKLRAAL